MDHPASGAELPRRNFQPWSSDAPGRRPGRPRISQARRVVPQGDKGPIIRRPSICQIIFRTSSSTGGSAQVSPLSNNHRPMAWLNASSGHSKSRSSMAGCFRISRRLGRRSGALWTLTTSNGGWKRSVLKAPGRPGRNGWLRTHSPGRLKKPCVQKTGCGTGPSPSGIKTIRIICPTLV